MTFTLTVVRAGKISLPSLITAHFLAKLWCFQFILSKMNTLRSDIGYRLHPVHPTVAASIGEEHAMLGQPAHSSSSIIEDPSSFLNQPGDSAFSNHQHLPVLQRYSRIRALFNISTLVAVFRICDILILVRIRMRMRILGSVSLTNGSRMRIRMRTRMRTRMRIRTKIFNDF
jgi:hypothetical protein